MKGVSPKPKPASMATNTMAQWLPGGLPWPPRTKYPVATPYGSCLRRVATETWRGWRRWSRPRMWTLGTPPAGSPHLYILQQAGRPPSQPPSVAANPHQQHFTFTFSYFHSIFNVFISFLPSKVYWYPSWSSIQQGYMYDTTLFTMYIKLLLLLYLICHQLSFTNQFVMWVRWILV